MNALEIKIKDTGINHQGKKITRGRKSLIPVRVLPFWQ
jgi:hypothetical protein